MVIFYVLALFLLMLLIFFSIKEKNRYLLFGSILIAIGNFFALFLHTKIAYNLGFFDDTLTEVLAFVSTVCGLLIITIGIVKRYSKNPDSRNCQSN